MPYLVMPTSKICKDKQHLSPFAGQERRSRDILDMVVTPDRIPQFIIPPLGVPEHKNCRKSHPVPGVWRSSPRQGSLDPRVMTAGFSGCLGEGADGEYPTVAELSDLSDPVTRAAMSLPHLIKVTTPYGFLTLGESPCIRRKESLFFDDDVRRRALVLKQRESEVKAALLIRRNSSPLSEYNKRLNPVATASEPGSHCRKSGRRSFSWDLISLRSDRLNLQVPLRQGREESENIKCIKNTEKSRLQSLIKKHLTSIKRLKSGSVLKRSRTSKG